MRLRDHILSTQETLSDLVLAAQHRFVDAEALLLQSRFAGAVYLFGLASEMWLKVACFRVRGVKLSDSVAAQLAPAKSWMGSAVPSVKPEAYHSLMFWAEYLISWRATNGSELPSSMVGQLRHHVSNRLFLDWKIDMRYRDVPVASRDGRRVYNDAWWVRMNWQALWR